ncbi:MAG: hypothetical protein ABFS56_26250 [Pseudomonadota bacterium]
MKEQNAKPAIVKDGAKDEQTEFKYESPDIKVYNEDELLNNVKVLGCASFSPV